MTAKYAGRSGRIISSLLVLCLAAGICEGAAFIPASTSYGAYRLMPSGIAKVQEAQQKVNQADALARFRLGESVAAAFGAIRGYVLAVCTSADRCAGVYAEGGRTPATDYGWDWKTGPGESIGYHSAPFDSEMSYRQKWTKGSLNISCVGMPPGTRVLYGEQFNPTIVNCGPLSASYTQFGCDWGVSYTPLVGTVMGYRHFEQWTRSDHPCGRVRYTDFYFTQSLGDVANDRVVASEVVLSTQIAAGTIAAGDADDKIATAIVGNQSFENDPSLDIPPGPSAGTALAQLQAGLEVLRNGVALEETDYQLTGSGTVFLKSTVTGNPVVPAVTVAGSMTVTIGGAVDIGSMPDVQLRNVSKSTRALIGVYARQMTFEQAYQEAWVGKSTPPIFGIVDRLNNLGVAESSMTWVWCMDIPRWGEHCLDLRDYNIGIAFAVAKFFVILTCFLAAASAIFK